MDYDASTIPQRYVAARALAPATLRQWQDVIAATLGRARPRRVVDVGCGTGRFTGALRDRFCSRVIGVDPSRRMLSQTPRTDGVLYVQARAESLPLADASTDMVFMSMVWHHITDHGAAAAEIRRTLSRRGFLCVRTSTIETLDSCLYLRFFPEARRINEATLPSRAKLQQWAALHGFDLLQRVAVTQELDSCAADYAMRIEKRALSDLTLITDAQFNSGLAALRSHCHGADRIQPVAETVDFFAFCRSESNGIG